MLITKNKRANHPFFVKETSDSRKKKQWANSHPCSLAPAGCDESGQLSTALNYADFQSCLSATLATVQKEIPWKGPHSTRSNRAEKSYPVWSRIQIPVGGFSTSISQFKFEKRQTTGQCHTVNKVSMLNTTIPRMEGGLFYWAKNEEKKIIFWNLFTIYKKLTIFCTRMIFSYV